MGKFRIFILSALIILATQSFAARSVISTLLSTSSSTFAGHDNITSSTGRIYVRLVNLTGSLQNVTVSLLNEKMETSIFVSNASGLSGWSAVTPPTGGWASIVNAPPFARPSIGAGAGIQTVAIAANGSAEVAFNAVCEFRLNGMACADSSTGTVSPFAPQGRPTCCDEHAACLDVNPGTTTPIMRDPSTWSACSANNQISGGSMTHTFQINISVAQDQGALIGSIFSHPDLGNGAHQTARDINYSMNGGRAF